MLQNTATESVVFLNFYTIPGYSRYVVNCSGDVFNLQSSAFLNGSTNPDGYHNIRLTSDENVCYTWGRHRLLGYVFLHPGIDISNLVINHKNGIKGDDRLINLEWTTYQGNTEHAGQFGLTEKCIPISVRDVRTGDSNSYPSIIEYSRQSGLTKDAVVHRIKIGERRIFPEGKQYRHAMVVGPWYEHHDIELAMCENGLRKQLLVRNVLTNEVTKFEKASDLANRMSVLQSTVSFWLSKPGLPVWPGLIQVKTVADKTPWREVTDIYLELEKTTGTRAVTVIDEKTSKEFSFFSAIECAKKLHLKPTALNYRLKSNGKVVFNDGYRYKYYSVKSS